MKRILRLPMMFLRGFVACASVLTSTIVVVMAVALEPLFRLKTFVDERSHIVSELLVMLYSASASGGIYVGNKLFGSTALASVKPVPWHRAAC